jgi:hypothetical protein
MKTLTRSSVPLAAAALLLASLFVLPATAHEQEPALRGELFTDPTRQFPMPDEWKAKPITHEKETGKADLVIVMDQDIYFTLLPIIEKFGRNNKLRVVVKEGTCGIAAGMLSKKTADMGGFCCPPGAEDRLPGLRFHTMGIVSLAFFVHPHNPVENVSSSQLRYLYRGKIYNWSELKTPLGAAGPDWKIKAVARLHCQRRPGHWRQMLDTDKEFSPRVSEVGSIPDMVAQVAASRNAIGWEVLTMVEKNKGAGKVKPLSIDGYRPNDSAALASMKYPYYRTYNLTTWEGKGVENRHAARLVEYMTREFDKLDPDRFGFVSASRLRKAGWKFSGNELIGEPKRK